MEVNYKVKIGFRFNNVEYAAGDDFSAAYPLHYNIITLENLKMIEKVEENFYAYRVNNSFRHNNKKYHLGKLIRDASIFNNLDNLLKGGFLVKEKYSEDMVKSIVNFLEDKEKPVSEKVKEQEKPRKIRLKMGRPKKKGRPKNNSRRKK